MPYYMNICSYDRTIMIKAKQSLKIFKSLSDSTRLRILQLLLRKELCVCKLSFILEMEQSRISHQLRVLRNADLVEGIREGKWIVYRVPEDKKKDLEFIFSRLLGDSLADSEEFIEDYKKLLVLPEINLRNYSVSSK